MSTLLIKPSVSVGALSLLIAGLMVLVALSRANFVTNPGPPANQPDTIELKAPRGEATDRDLSVPAASGVIFPTADDGQAPAATF